jgi:hypothetical protein
VHHDFQPMRRVVVCVFQASDLGKDLAASDANMNRSLDPDIDMIGKYNNRCAFCFERCVGTASIVVVASSSGADKLLHYGGV